MTDAALWVGDSFTAGEGADVPASLTYPHLVGERLDWVCHVDAQAGTGFVNSGFLASSEYAPLLARLPDDVRRFAADVVVLDGGRNDVDVAPTALRVAIDTYLTALRGSYPDARVVIVLPSLVDEVQPQEYRRIGGLLREAASSYRAAVVDPAGTGAFADPALNRTLVCEDGFHPSAAGQAHYAEVLTRLLS
jgi:lysophospholipase L1-like esterase